MSNFEPHHITPTSGAPGIAPPLGATAHRGASFSAFSHSSGPAGKRRKTSKAKASPTLKRAASTPQMGGLGDQETDGLSPSALDKRRNKLGYQRISIACGHCRRRKIRCVLAEQDEMGRCQNCIRLKKECVFYPVDSVGGTESRAQQKPGSGSKASSVISNSPSDRKLVGVGDHDRDFGRFPPLASNAPSDLTPGSSGSGLGISTGTAMTTPEYGFDPGASTREGWQSGIFQHPDSASSDTSAAPSWRVQDSPRVGDFSTFPTTEGQPGVVYSNFHYPPSRGEYSMQPPMRSMSYGNVEPSIGQFPVPVSTSSVDLSRQQQHATHYTLPSTDAGHMLTTTSSIDPAMTPAATETISQYGVYSPQWQYYQQNPQAVGMDFTRHDSVSMQWYTPQMGQGMDEQGRLPQHLHQQWQQQQTQQHMMPPPGSGYGKGHSTG